MGESILIDDSKTINARDITSEPDEVFTITRPYIFVRDESITGRFNELIEALTILKDAGWNAVNTIYTGGAMFVLMENTNYKRKNQ